MVAPAAVSRKPRPPNGTKQDASADAAFATKPVEARQASQSRKPARSTIGDCRARVVESSLLPPLLSQQLADLLHLFFADFLVLDEVNKQRLGGSVEDAPH